MLTLSELVMSRLHRVQRVSDGWTAQCPCCAAQGHDKTGNHLRIWAANGAFNCVVGSGDDEVGREHNRAIRRYIYDGVSPDVVLSLERSVVDPDPKLDADKVYPDSMLLKLKQDHSYWLNRGIREDVLRRLEGGVVPKDPPNKLSNRYVFPIRDPNSRQIVGWTGRLISDASFGPKWKHMLRAKRTIYPLHIVKPDIMRAKKVVLVESIGDMLALMSAGIPYCLVLFGLNLNSRLMGFLLAANLDEIVISTNNDAVRVGSDGAEYRPGQEAADKIARQIGAFLGDSRVRVRLPTTSKDWNDVLLGGGDELVKFKAELEGLSLSPPVEQFVL